MAKFMSQTLKLQFAAYQIPRDVFACMWVGEVLETHLGVKGAPACKSLETTALEVLRYPLPWQYYMYCSYNLNIRLYKSIPAALRGLTGEFMFSASDNLQ